MPDRRSVCRPSYCSDPGILPAWQARSKAAMAGDWSDTQNDAIVASYFSMLANDIAGQPYSKAEHNRLLQVVIGCPRGSIEYKHQNISAVLKRLGKDWIPGYKPAFNFQASLVDAVVRWLDRHPDWLAPAARMATGLSL